MFQDAVAFSKVEIVTYLLTHSVTDMIGSRDARASKKDKNIQNK